MRLLAGVSCGFLIHDAIFSDQTGQFVSNPNPKTGETVKIKLRTAFDNVIEARLILAGKSLPMKKSHRSDDSHFFDYYETEVAVSEILRYCFYVRHISGAFCYFDALGVADCARDEFFFRVIPDFSVPDWAMGAVMYQIYIDRFYNGDKSNDVVNNEYAYLSCAAKFVDKWDKGVAKMDICNFYGGDLRGVIEKLDYLSDLGVECIYFTPLFVSPSNHKYDIQDYDHIDPHIGVIPNDGGDPLYFEKFRNRYATKYMKRTTDVKNLEASNALFAELVKEAHKRGVRVIIDGVFNHCGAFNKWLDKEGFYASKGYEPGAYRDKNSPYRNFFKWYAEDWPNNDCYDGWWGHDNHPKLNYEGSPELCEYIYGVGEKWVSKPFCADGWRLDVAADLGFSPQFNHAFWKAFRQSVKKANPDALILAEHYGDAESWLRGDEWDSVMNYDAFMEPITWFLTGMEKHSEEFNAGLLNNAQAFTDAIIYHMTRFSYQSLNVSMNELSNHDHSRFLTRTNMRAGRLHTAGAKAADEGINVNIMFEAVIFQFTWPGAPTVYYGDEAGVTGWTDPDNRRTYPWGHENLELIAFHKEMIKLRKSNPCLRHGSLKFLYADYGVVSYARFDKACCCVIALNNNDAPKTVFLPVWQTAHKNARFERLIISGANTFSTQQALFEAERGMLELSLPPFSGAVLKTV